MGAVQTKNKRRPMSSTRGQVKHRAPNTPKTSKNRRGSEECKAEPGNRGLMKKKLRKDVNQPL